MKRSLLLIFFAWGAGISCGREAYLSEGNMKVVMPITNVIMPDSIEQQQKLTVQLRAEGWNGCFKFSHLEAKQNNKQVIIKAFANFPKGPGVCSAVMVYADTIYQQSFTQKGAYSFFFLSHNNKYIEKMLIVK